MTYKVPFVNYPAHYRSMKREIDTVIKEVLSKGDLILRSDVRDFENNMANFLGVKYAVGTNSCTDALNFSMRAAGVGRDDEVITVAHTFVATIEAIVHCGATPDLIDVREDFNMDMEKLEPVLTPKTRAIIPVHLNGRLCDMERLISIANKHNLIVIEDSAQALGATFNKKKGGAFGLAGCFSFYPAKILGATGDAGLVSTNDKNFAEKIRLLRDHGRRGKNEIACYGFTSRLDNLQAAILNVKLKYLPNWIQRRREIADLYNKGLSNVPGVNLPPPPNSDTRFFDVYQNYVIRSKRRNELALHLKKSGVEVLISWPRPLHKQKALNLSHFNLPVTERISKEVISLPIYPELTNKEVKYVIDCIRKFNA